MFVPVLQAWDTKKKGFLLYRFVMLLIPPSFSFGDRKNLFLLVLTCLVLICSNWIWIWTDNIDLFKRRTEKTCWEFKRWEKSWCAVGKKGFVCLRRQEKFSFRDGKEKLRLTKLKFATFEFVMKCSFLVDESCCLSIRLRCCFCCSLVLWVSVFVV